MGVLTGKFTAQMRFPEDDNRSREEGWRNDFVDSAVAPLHLKNPDVIRESLMRSGCSLTQGALGWIMAKSPHNIPIPGARTDDQIVESAGANELGLLSEDVMSEIETLIEHRAEGEPRDR